MYYIARLKNNNAKICLAPPKDLPYVAVEQLPEDGSIPKFDHKGNLYFAPPIISVEEDPKEDPIKKLEQENKLLKAQIQAQADRAEFLEDCLAELISVVYS